MNDETEPKVTDDVDGASLADSEEPGSDGTTAETEGPDATSVAEPIDDRGEARSPRAASAVALFAILVAAVAAAGAGFLWWQYRQFYIDLNDADSLQTRALEEARASIRRLEDTLAEAAEALATDRQQIQLLQTRIETIEPRIAGLDQRLDSVQGSSFDARSLWLRAEAEYYLATANTELTVAGHWENATAALQLADDLLRELGDPALNATRAMIAQELASLNAVQLPDVEGLAYSLASLAGQVAEFPLRGISQQSFDQADPELDEMEPGLGRLMHGLRQAVLGIIRVERRTEPVAVVLSEEEQHLVRRQLELELTLARVALLRGQSESFQAALSAAADMLRRDFASDAGAVASAERLLAEMARIEIAPPRPDISRSLNMLRAAPGGGR